MKIIMLKIIWNTNCIFHNVP